MTPEAQKNAAAPGSFCCVTTENGEQQDIYNLTTIPDVQRSLFLDEVIDDSSSTQVEFPKGVDSQTRDMLERCMATCGKAASKSKGQEEIPPHELIDAVTSCILYSRVSNLGTLGTRGTAQQNGAKDAFTESRDRSPMEAAFEKTLEFKAGSPATGKYLFWNRWKRSGTTRSDQT